MQDQEMINSLGLLGTGQLFTLLTFPGLAKMPSAERTLPKNTTLNWKKVALFRVNFYMEILKPIKYYLYPV